MQMLIEGLQAQSRFKTMDELSSSRADNCESVHIGDLEKESVALQV